MAVFIIREGVPQPKVFNLVCDGISMTLDVPIECRSLLKKNIQEIPNFAPKGNYKEARSYPLNNKYLPFGADKTGTSNLIIQCDPKDVYKKKNMRFLRVDWNPNYCDEEGVIAVLDNILPGLFEKLMKQGYVTRLDLAVDVAQVRCDDLLYHYPKSVYTDVKSKSGRTEYIGSSKSPVSWCLYDKQAEIVAKNKKKGDALKLKIPSYSLTRIEVRLKPKGYRLAGMFEQANPFGKLTVSSYANFNYKADAVWELFLDSCRLRGAQAALFKLKGTPFHTNYKKRLGDGLVSWWKPDDIWGQLPMVIANIAQLETFNNDVCID